MPIDARVEQILPLSQIREFLPPSPRTGRPVHPSALVRWIHHGLKAGDGSTVHLEALKCGGSLCTSREAVHRFFSELSTRAGLKANSLAVCTHESEQTGRELVAVGLK
jgi:hypothetical protein